jgi:hypothetical protein
MYISAWLYKLGVPKIVLAYSNPNHTDVELDHARTNALSTNGGGRTLVNGIMHGLEWWTLARYLQNLGMLEQPEEEASLAWNQSMIFIAGTGVVAFLAVVLGAYVIVKTCSYV